MTTLILKRLGIGLVTVLAVSLIIFFGTKILPGDAAQIRLGQSATPENVAAFRARLGLDQPYIVQYLNRTGACVQRQAHTGQRQNWIGHDFAFPAQPQIWRFCRVAQGIGGFLLGFVRGGDGRTGKGSGAG